MSNKSKDIINLLKSQGLAKEASEPGALEKEIKVPAAGLSSKKERGRAFNTYAASIPKELYHETTTDVQALAAKDKGLIRPHRGSIVNQAYGRDAELPKPKPGVFLHDNSDNLMGGWSHWQIKNKLGRDPTADEYIQHASIAHVDPSNFQHSDIMHHYGDLGGERMVKPFKNQVEDRRIQYTHIPQDKMLRTRHIEPGDYFSVDPIMPHKFLSGEHLKQDIHQNPTKYHPDVLKLFGLEKPVQMSGDPEKPSVVMMNKSKIESLITLQKGSRQRKYPVQPIPQKELDGINSWQSGAPGAKRENVPAMEANRLERAKANLARHAQVRQGENGSEYLLHRGMSPEEHAASVKGENVDHSVLSSWTPKLDTAEKLANNYAGHLVSAWVPGSHIHSYLPQAGELDYRGESEHLKEHEVVVAPGHNSSVHTGDPTLASDPVHKRINHKARAQAMREQKAKQQGAPAAAAAPQQAETPKDSGVFDLDALLNTHSKAPEIGGSMNQSGMTTLAVGDYTLEHAHSKINPKNGHTADIWHLQPKSKLHARAGEFHVSHHGDDAHISYSSIDSKHRGTGKLAYSALSDHYGGLKSDPTGRTSDSAAGVWNKIGKPNTGGGIAQYQKEGNPEKPPVRLINKSKIESLITLQKGSLQRKWDVKNEPVTDKYKTFLSDWQEGGERTAREEAPAMEPNRRKRALHYLSGQTTSRVNENGTREFLLHRGMGNEEHDTTVASGRINPEMSSSWTPDPKVAHVFRRSGKMVSAWVPESHIQTVPNAHASSYKWEKEVVVKPGHNSEVHAVHQSVPENRASGLDQRINQRAASVPKPQPQIPLDPLFENLAPVVKKPKQLFSKSENTPVTEQVEIGDEYILVHLHSNNAPPEMAAKGYSSIDTIELVHPHSLQVLAGASVTQGDDVEPIVHIGFIQEQHRSPKLAQKAFDALKSKYDNVPESVLRFMETVWGAMEDGPTMASAPAQKDWQSFFGKLKINRELLKSVIQFPRRGNVPSQVRTPQEQAPQSPEHKMNSTQYVKIAGHPAWHRVLDIKDTKIKAGQAGGGNVYTIHHTSHNKPVSIYQDRIEDLAFGDQIALGKSGELGTTALQKDIEPLSGPMNERDYKLMALSGETQLGTDVMTGDKAYLLFRGMNDDEFNASVGNDGFIQSEHQTTWTPFIEVAAGFGESKRLVGAWVSEEFIKLAANPPDKQFDQEHKRMDMYHVMVTKGHRSKALGPREMQQMQEYAGVQADEVEKTFYSAGNGYILQKGEEESWDLYHVPKNTHAGRIAYTDNEGCRAELDPEHQIGGMQERVQELLNNHYQSNKRNA